MADSGIEEGLIDRLENPLGKTLWTLVCLAAIALAALGLFAGKASAAPVSRVLVAGGQMEDPSTHQFLALDTAEIYNSGTETFTASASLMTARKFHTASTLSTGAVLITGGADSLNAPLGSAELYDPASDKFTATTLPMNQPRAFHTATLLSDGRVLIAGGQGRDPRTGQLVALDTAEIYNPSNQSFTLVSCTVNGVTTNDCMTSPRISHTATFLSSGKVLIAGGANYVNGIGVIENSAELFDPVSNSFSPTGSMLDAHELHTATLLNSGTVLLVGGLVGSGSPNSTGEIYDPASGLFTFVWSSMSATRFEHTATLLGSGKVLLVGGASSTTADLYNPRKAAFAKASGSMTTLRFQHTATLLGNGSVLIAGGSGSVGGASLASAEVANPRASSFSATGAMSWARAGHTATLLP